jgi:hypothetical protein
MGKHVKDVSDEEFLNKFERIWIGTSQFGQRIHETIEKFSTVSRKQQQQLFEQTVGVEKSLNGLKKIVQQKRQQPFGLPTPITEKRIQEIFSVEGGEPTKYNTTGMDYELKPKSYLFVESVRQVQPELNEVNYPSLRSSTSINKGMNGLMGQYETEQLVKICGGRQQPTTGSQYVKPGQYFSLIQDLFPEETYSIQLETTTRPMPLSRQYLTKSERRGEQQQSIVGQCPVCGICAGKEIAEFELHVNGHFSD